jgi:hypothetical protein
MAKHLPSDAPLEFSENRLHPFRTRACCGGSALDGPCRHRLGGFHPFQDAPGIALAQLAPPMRLEAAVQHDSQEPQWSGSLCYLLLSARQRQETWE